MKKILVETSARHIHLSQADLEVLCGKGATLEVRGMLSQPGQFASKTRLQVIGTKRNFDSVTVLGPTRSKSQVEISLTDALMLGLKAPVRESGDIKGTPGVKLIGSVGEIELSEGLIIAKRHIHMTPEDAAEFNVVNGEVVAVRVKSAERSSFLKMSLFAFALTLVLQCILILMKLMPRDFPAKFLANSLS